MLEFIPNYRNRFVFRTISTYYLFDDNLIRNFDY